MKYSVVNRVVHKIEESLCPVFAPVRRKKLNNTDFTIISNNCWGGILYEYFGLPKQSPTVGTYFFAEDYVQFVSNLQYYVRIPIEMITVQDSKHCKEIMAKGESDVPIGRLGDVEIVFLHYKDPVVAKEKWERRIKRINWDNLIIKFSYMNGCTDEHVAAFEKLSGMKKFVFTAKKFPYKDAIVIPGDLDGQISNDTFYFKKWINIYQLINTSLFLA